MYLSDKDLNALLPELGFEAHNGHHPFRAAEQIQPCSVDLRIASSFWRPSRRRYWWRRPLSRHRPPVDLRQAHMQDLDPRRDWRPFTLDEGEAHTIKPGQVLMGRVYERFSIPSGYAGKIEGRSSFARLGLFVHCTGDFINPGWGGFMPLQLFNAGPYPIKITPYVSICQLMLVRLSSDPDRTYGQAELESKYVNDDGGPSFWWRDRSIKALHERIGEVHAPARLVQEVLDIYPFEDPELLARFQTFVGKQRVEQLENADELLGRFSRRETWRRRVDVASLGAFPLLASAALGTLFVHPVSGWHYLIWVLTALAIPVSLRGLAMTDTDYLTQQELRRARARNRPQQT